MSKLKTVDKQPTLNPEFSEYWQNHIVVIPEIDGIPQINGTILNWGKFYNSKHDSNIATGKVYVPNDDELLEWDLLDKHGFALVTGEVSGIIGLDFDHALPEHIIKAEQLLGFTPVKKFGSKGLTLFYAYNGEKSENWHQKGGPILCELLSHGRKTTLPPSIHRTTKKQYIWTGTHSLFSGRDLLPKLTSNYKSILDSLFSITREVEREYLRHDYDLKPSYNDAVEALNCCDPNCNNDEWVQIGMAFRSEVGDAGYSDFDAWSSGGKTYDKNSIRGRWRSFNSHSIGYGTLVYYAKQGGYQLPRAKPMQPTISMSVEDWTSRKLEAYAEQVRKSETLPDFYTNAPHHIKAICDWIVSTARYPQPIITLGAVLAFLGFYMGREFKYKGIKGNIYNINIGRTGHGKEHIIACIRGLFIALGMPELIGGSGATSDTAMLSLLKENDGKTCYIIDEFQGFMKVLSNKKSSNSREAGLVGLLLKAYTSRILSGVDYANRKERETVTIPNPYLSLCSFCTPEPFFDAVGSAEAFNGFIGRLTVFEAPKILPQRNKDHNPEADLNIPHDILEMLRIIKGNRKKEHHPDGSFSYCEYTEVPATPEAHNLLETMNDDIDNKRREYDQENSQMSNVIARVFEMMKKYSLIASRGKEITIEHVTWAKSLADYNVGIMVAAASNLADTRFERKKNQVVEYIEKRNGLISKTDFTRGCRIFEGRRERDEVILDLKESGILEVVDIPGPIKSATGYKLIT